MEPWELEDFLEFAAIRRDERLDPLPDYFWRTYFGTTYNAGNDRINFADLPVAHRKLAPFVMPTSQGKPVFERRSGSIESFKPAYIKMKDAVRIVEANNVQLVDLINGNGGPNGLQARHDRAVAEVAEYHLRALDMRRCMMAAEAFIAAQVTVEYISDRGEPAPAVVIDFDRDPALDVTLTGQFIDDPDFPLVDFLTDMSNTQYNTRYGGRPTQWIVGSEVAPFVTKNKSLLALLNTQIRGAEDTTMQRGLMGINQPLSRIATVGGLNGSIDILTYKDVVEAPDGEMVDLLNPKDSLLIAPGAGGVMAYGAIWDKKAWAEGYIGAEVYQKQFDDNDPGDDYVLTQSAPLPINTQPNKVARMRMLGA